MGLWADIGVEWGGESMAVEWGGLVGHQSKQKQITKFTISGMSATRITKSNHLHEDVLFHKDPGEVSHLRYQRREM